MAATGGELDELDRDELEAGPGADAPEVDFEPAEAEAGEDPTRVRRMHLGGQGDQEEPEDEGPQRGGDVPGKMSREEFATHSVLIWSVPGMKDPRLRPLGVTRQDDADRIEGAMAVGRVAYDLIADWAPGLLPPPIDDSGDMGVAFMFLWSQKMIFDAIKEEARAAAARDVSPEDLGQ